MTQTLDRQSGDSNTLKPVLAGQRENYQVKITSSRPTSGTSAKGRRAKAQNQDLQGELNVPEQPLF